MLSESKFSKYLLYAIGEILLVVVGILIALQINNANAEGKLRNKELVLLEEMRQNLTEDLVDLEYNISGNLKRTHANEQVLDALQNRKPMSDALKGHYGNIFGNFQLSENTAAWENLKSVGLDLVSNDQLRNTISNLYSTKYIYLENVEKGVDDGYQWDHLYPQVLKHLNVDTMWVSATPVDHEALMEDREFQEVLKMNLFFRHYMQSQYDSVESDINAILEQLDEHIQTLEEHQ